MADERDGNGKAKTRIRKRSGPGTYSNRITRVELAEVMVALEAFEEDLRHGEVITAMEIARSLGAHPLRVQQALRIAEEMGIAERISHRMNTDWRTL